MYCNSLTSIPYTLFDNNTDATDFSSVFRLCPNLTGIVPQLWDTSRWSNVSYSTYCFDNTGVLSHSGTTIPKDWGGKLVADGGCCDASCNTTQCTGL